MAAVTVSDSNIRVQDCEGSFSGGTITGGTGASTNADIKIQGSYSWGRKVGSGSVLFGFWYNATLTDMTAAGNEVVMMKVANTNPGGLQANGLHVRIGTSSTVYHQYKISDDGTRGDIDYPVLAGWLVVPIDPSVASWYYSTAGTPALNSIDVYAVAGYWTGSARDHNVFTDATDIGPGLYLIGGDAAADGTFQSFIDDDEGDPTTGRFGHVTTKEGILYCYGELVIGRTAAGTSTLTEFTDSNKTLVFPGGYVDAGWNAIEADLATANSYVRMTACTFVGRGRTEKVFYFDTDNDTDGANERLVLSLHNITSGRAILYSKQGGSEAIGLTDATEYWLSRDSNSTVKIHTSFDDSYTITSPVNLTASSVGSGEEHKLTIQPDTRPDFTTTGAASGTELAMDACTFQNLRDIILTSVATFDGCAFIGCRSIDTGAGLLTGCSFSQQTTDIGVALVTTSDLETIEKSTFSANTADNAWELSHAVEIDTAGTYDFDANIFIDYGPTEIDFNASTDVEPALDEIVVPAAFYSGLNDGDAVYYEDRGGTTLSGLTDGGKYYVRVSDTTTNTVALFHTRKSSTNNTERIALTVGSDEDHSLCAANAAIVNTSGGAVTINILNGGTVASVRTTGGTGSTTVNNAVTIEVTGVTEGSRVSIYKVSDDTELLNALAFESDGAGTFKASASFDYITDTDVIIRARSQGKPVAAVAYDLGTTTYTDETIEANDAAANMSLTQNPEGVGDIYYFGHTEQFDQLLLEIGTYAVEVAVTWEYWNISSWKSLGGVSDGTRTGAYTYVKDGIVSWTNPGVGWTTTTVNSQGPYYYVRARVTGLGLSSSHAIGKKVTFDVTRYLAFNQTNTIKNTGLSAKAVWIADPVAQFPSSL
ncbi:MAG: hypothetical protein DRJ50_06485 [Actinobacteria bacterium]|nr:MAG: hypothetical protein DRJ50_06485 [Actinomycetota bacterium]